MDAGCLKSRESNGSSKSNGSEGDLPSYGSNRSERDLASYGSNGSEEINRVMGVVRVMIVKEVDGERTVKEMNRVKVATGYRKKGESNGRKGTKGKLGE